MKNKFEFNEWKFINKWNFNKWNKPISNDFVDRWHSDAFKSKDIAMKIFKDITYNLIITPHPSSGWRSLPNQKLQTIQINENGLRSPSLKNLKFKKNCLLFGGSTAWGFGASSNEYTPSYLIEELMSKKYGIEFNVINFGEQMHTSFEEMKTFISVVDELDPILVIFLSGVNDINVSYINLFKSSDLYSAWIHYFLWGYKLGIVREQNIFKQIIKFILRSHKKNKIVDQDYFFFKKPKRDNIFLDLYSNKVSFLNSYCSAKEIKIVHLLQPDLLFKKDKSDFETKYTNYLPDNKKEFNIKSFKILKEKFFRGNNDNDKHIFIDCLNFFEEFKETIFVDENHFSDKGNQILSEKVCSQIVKKNIL